MTRLRIALRNYRCFSASQPAVFELGRGFTAFIGPNNAGKSTVLKFLYELRPMLALLSLLGSPGQVGQILNGGRMGVNFPSPITDQTEIICETASTPCQIELTIEPERPARGSFLQTALWTYFSELSAWQVDMTASTGASIRTQDPGTTCRGLDSGDFLMTDDTRCSFVEMLAAVGALQRTLYLGPFRNAVNEGAASYFDLQIGTAFLTQWHNWKTGGNKQQNRAVGRVTEDVRRLMGVSALEINASNELKTLQLSINGRPHKLSEVGAGIAQLIIVLGNALIFKPAFIAIDEPETHLHPALQLDFLTTLASYASEGVLFATHSIGLARATADRLYSVQAGTHGSIVRPYDRTPHYAEFLGSLGVAGLQDIGCNKILLVEGTSDVRTFQQWLRCFGKDREVVVLPLGGSSLINGKTAPQLQEIMRFGSLVFAVVDSEKNSADAAITRERREFADNCAALGIRCLVVERRATENYLPDRAVRAAFGSSSAALQPFEAAVPWGKSENWRAAREMTKEDLADTDLGGFLAAI